MGIQLGAGRWICLSGNQPAGPVIGVAISLLVDGDDIHQNNVVRGWFQAGEGDS